MVQYVDVMYGVTKVLKDRFPKYNILINGNQEDIGLRIPLNIHKVNGNQEPYQKGNRLGILHKYSGFHFLRSEVFRNLQTPYWLMST